jgi:hypothetical protein
MEKNDLYFYEYTYGSTIMEGVRNNIVGGKWFEISSQLTTNVVLESSVQHLMGRKEVQNIVIAMYVPFCVTVLFCVLFV